ncbi:MAG: SDR family oxidoreductase [Pirellulales bacterium]|nr:SDR family oxidoreductase [Pirellulales bacterium]
MQNTSTDQRRVCAVTGGSGGIGLATAKKFATQGYSVALCGRNEAKLAQAAAQIATDAAMECQAITIDLSQPQAGATFIADVLDRLGRVDVLVNNAGAAVMAPLEELAADEFERMLSVNVAATFHATQTAWRAMQQQGSGVIVNVASQAAKDPFPGFAVYGACKAWAALFTQAIAKEGKPAGVRAYAVLPGAVETAMLRGVLPDFPAEQALAPADVAETIFALCQPPWRHASGSVIDIMK